MGRNMSSLKCKQKLCCFPEDKNSNRRKVLVHELHEKLFKVICEKAKSIPFILVLSIVLVQMLKTGEGI